MEIMGMNYESLFLTKTRAMRKTNHKILALISNREENTGY